MPYKNPEDKKANSAKYRENNREEINARNRIYYEENREKINEKEKIRRERDKDKIKERQAKWYQENIEQERERRARTYEENAEEIKAKNKTYCHAIVNCAMAMLMARVITDDKLWHTYCQKKRARNATTRYPFSVDFTDDLFFEKMKDGCFYCGDLATTIDRLDSSLGHTPDNCVGCCWPCNFSKGNGDPNSFVRKAYFRARGRYFDDIEAIWSDNIKTPFISDAKSKSKRQKRPFALTQDEWDVLTIGNCAYCHRSRPENKWFGVDRVIPTDGYTPDNTVSCCHDCNNDKGELFVEDMKKRNDKIAKRLESGMLSFFDCATSLRNKGWHTYI